MTSNKSFFLAGQAIETELSQISFEMIEQRGYFTAVSGDKKFNIVVDNINTDTKEVDLLINNILYQVSIKTSLDELLESMGMDLSGSKKLTDIKSPMPGRILQYLKQPGDNVEPGDGILVLEAMKMENVIKSEGAGIVKELSVPAETVVNKGDLLVTFE